MKYSGIGGQAVIEGIMMMKVRTMQWQSAGLTKR